MQEMLESFDDENGQETLCQLIYDDLIEEIVLGIYFQVHRSMKLGFLFLDESTYEDERKYEIVNEKGFDIFGQSSAQLKKQYECVCPSCQRSLSAQRFAPHLEKCMGMGRNSSRIASKRIASVSGKFNDDSDFEEQVVKRVKKKKTNSKRQSGGNLNNGNCNSSVHSV